MRGTLAVVVLLAGLMWSSGCGPKPCCAKPPPNCEHHVELLEVDTRSLTGASFVGFGSETAGRAIAAIEAANAERVAELERLCRDNVAGRLEWAVFRERVAEIGDEQRALRDLVAASAEPLFDESVRLEALRRAYATVAAEHVDLGVELQVFAKLPDDDDYGLSRWAAELPTGATVQLRVVTTIAAYVYVYHLSPAKVVQPLFPSSWSAASNPAATGEPLVVLGDGVTATLREEDVGINQIHVVAANHPLPALEAALREAEVDPGSVDVERLDCAATEGLEGIVEACLPVRGLWFQDGDAHLGYSVKGLNAVADDVVHTIYIYEQTPG